MGAVEEICETIEERRAAYGLSYYSLYKEHIETMAPVVERLSGA